jgi:hypothetical protein
MDNAYRFRAQDILSELNQVSLKKNPIKELLRLLDLIQSRESAQEVKDTWTLLKYIVKFYLRFDKNLKSIIVHSLSNLDLDKVKLIINDKLYCIPRKDYTFGFQVNPTPEDKKMMESNRIREEFKEQESKIKQESTKAHQESKGSLVELDSKYEQLLNDAKLRYETKKHELGLL